jgi:aminopeptidase N
MVRDAELAARQYVPLVLNNIHGEDDIGVVQDLLGQCSAAIDVYGDPENAAALSGQLADRAQAFLAKTAPGSDLQLTWAHAFIGEARTPEHLAILRGILDGTVRYEGLKVDFDVRWSIVAALAARGAADGLIDAELKRDPTDLGQRNAATARAAQPTAEAKSQAWAAVTEDRSLPLATMRAIMRGFHRYEQRSLLEPYAPIYFATLDPFWKSRTIEVALAFAGGMYPRVLIGQRTVRMTDDFLNSDSHPGPVRRILLEGRDTIQRAMRARAFDSAQTGVGSVTAR